MYKCGTTTHHLWHHSLGSGTHILFSYPRTCQEDLSQLTSGDAKRSQFSWWKIQTMGVYYVYSQPEVRIQNTKQSDGWAAIRCLAVSLKIPETH